ncbi:ADP-ribosylglycohydrolase family protein [Microbacterium sp. ASV49]|uniref:ADP-ribosylglycohydrolase family protein n=1 Tax=Microbacterium candidum TaxID=3041922 RepID=A0ABT7MVE7_9MICO|nr:ADP-ribosylglycohydrolase family protein [Microbacterium sp. ASV49]MDL9978432.1 ADP-ribosylglycohydrolase family protein [Microbacterium sp. ASV49]
MTAPLDGPAADVSALEDRVLGVLLGAAIGDAMGAATELRTREQIVEHFGGEVTSFVVPPDDTFARGCPPGQVTDDFSQAYHLARTIVARGGETSWDTGRDAILAWWADERYQRFAGPTTRASVLRLAGEEVETPFFRYRGGQATNGAAMRIAPVGCVAENVTDALHSAIAVSLPTHDNHLAAAAAAIVAIGVNVGLSHVPHGDETPFALVAMTCAAFAGPASRAAETATHIVPGASLAARIELAIEVARDSVDVQHAAARIAAVVGCGLMANEAVPAAVGILSVAPDAMSAVTAAVNAGDDTDTVATIVGALAGSVAGSRAFPRELAETVVRVNDMDLAGLARDLVAVRHLGAA